MASNDVQICNIALSRVAAYSIQSLNESSKTAKECKIHYEPARDATLADHNWNFARREVQLSLLTSEFSGWDYAYRYPNDCLKARKIYNASGTASGFVYDPLTQTYVTQGRVPFEVVLDDTLSNSAVLTNEEDAILIYTAKVTNPVVFSPNFSDALSFRMAAELAQTLRGDSKLQDGMMQKYWMTIGQAKRLDSNERYEKPDDSSSFSRARA